MKNSIKRFLCLSLIFAFLLSSPVTVAATDSKTEIVFGEVLGKAGSVVSLPILINNNQGIATYRFRIPYDTANLSFVSAENSASFANGSIVAQDNKEGGYVTVLWFSVTNVTSNGVMAVLSFKLSDNADGEFALVPNYKPEDLLNQNSVALNCTVTSGKILTKCTNHKGGNATCTDRAVCSVCNEAYGELLPHSLNHFGKNPANHYTSGNIEYWQCGVCNKFFSDSNAKNEISEADTLLAKQPHTLNKWDYNDTKHWLKCDCGFIDTSYDHDYDNACDTECNVCGFVRSIKHDYSKVWSCDKSKHWHECSVCGDKTDLDEHSYDNDCDTYCNVCGDLRVTEHKYDNDCDTDCNVCGDLRVTEHKYDNDCDTDCNVCGDVRVTEHKYDNDCDTDCNICGDVRVTEHRYDNDCDTDCNICGDVRVTEHRYDNDCDTDCNICGDVRVTEHKYDGDFDTDCNVCGDVREFPVKLGDVNGDKKINNLDAGFVLKYDAGISDLTAAQKMAADVNGDGRVNNLDASAILKYDAGIISGF